jgi:endonuclease YncB( thermonuclease family)
MKKIIIFVGLLLLTANLIAGEMSGLVTFVYDGDSCKVRSGGIEYEIRLYGIDAPEKGQHFAEASKSLLMKLISHKNVKIVYQQQDRYGRLVATIYQGKLNVNLEMIRLGLAWHYKHYSKDKDFAEAETEARKDKRGMWKYDDNISPWTWRRGKRNAQAF